jgi:hypothetical protein
LPLRVFVIPAAFVLALPAIWNGIYLLYLTAPEDKGVGTWVSAVSTLGGMVLPSRIAHGLRHVLGFDVANLYSGWLVPACAYVAYLSLDRNSKQAQQWTTMVALVVGNLSWWLFSAGFSRHESPTARSRSAFALAGWAWMLMVVVLPGLVMTARIVAPPFNSPQAMAEYLNRHVPFDMTVETWEQEMRFLTAHRYHSPPPEFQDATMYATLSGTDMPDYDFVDREKPQYLLIGKMSRGSLYERVLTTGRYSLTSRIGEYELYERADGSNRD